MSDFLKLRRNGQVLEIVLDRPKANAIDTPCSREMGRVFADFRDDPNLRVAVLTGAGEKFLSAGWDLNATENLSFEESYAALRSKTWPAFMNMLESEDAREGARAFIEKREPHWKGW